MGSIDAITKEYTSDNKFHTEIGPVLEFIRNSRDSEKLRDLLNEKPVYRETDRESAVLLNAVAGLRLNLKKEKGVLNTCKAWEDYAKDYAKELTIKSVRNMIRKGIPYEAARGIIEGVSDEELRQMYEEEQKPF